MKSETTLETFIIRGRVGVGDAYSKLTDTAPGWTQPGRPNAAFEDALLTYYHDTDDIRECEFLVTETGVGDPRTRAYRISIEPVLKEM